MIINESEQQQSPEVAVLTDVDTLHSRALAHIDEDAVTVGYCANRTAALKPLNDSLATKLICVLCY